MGKSASISKVVLLLVLFTNLFISPAYAAVGDINNRRTFEPKNPPLWLACSTLKQTDNCIESIEYFDDTTKTWIKGIEEKNPWYKAGEILPSRDEDPTKFTCGTGNTGGLDVCYRFPNIAVDGTAQYVGTTIYSTEEVAGFPRIKISFQALNGEDTRKPKDPNIHGYLILKPGTTWRVTLLADKIAQQAGLAWAWMKNPNIDVTVGTDGKHRLVTSGTVQEVHLYSTPGNLNNPCNDQPKNELTANAYLVEYSINIDPYVREYSTLLGTAPGGIFITQNGGCNFEVKFDEKNQKILVISKGAHYDVFGNVIIGWVEASIRGDLIRKVFKLEPKTMHEALIEVTDSDGVVQTATFTTRYVPESDKVEIKGYGYTFSQKTITITFDKPATITSQSGTQNADPNTKKNTNVDTVVGQTNSTNPIKVVDLKPNMTLSANSGDIFVFKSSTKGSWSSKVTFGNILKIIPVPKKSGVATGVAVAITAKGGGLLQVNIGKKTWVVKINSLN